MKGDEGSYLKIEAPQWMHRIICTTFKDHWMMLPGRFNPLPRIGFLSPLSLQRTESPATSRQNISFQFNVVSIGNAVRYY